MYQLQKVKRCTRCGWGGPEDPSSSAGCSLRAAGALAVRFVLWHLLVAAPCLALLGTRVLAQTAGVTVSETDVIADESTSAGYADYTTYTIVLDAMPSDSVKIVVTSSDDEIATVNPGTLTFTTSNYNTAQTVTVSGVDDDVDQTEEREVTISHTATSNDGDYSGIVIPGVSVLIYDDLDFADLLVTESNDPTSVTEASGDGNTDTHTVVLNSEPTHDVTVGVASDDTEAATVSPATLTFTSANWSIVQTVTVTGVDDDVDNTDDERTPTISYTASSDDLNYDNSSFDVVVKVTDEDIVGTTITESDDATIVTEASGASNTDTYTIVLSTEPTADVEIAAVVGSGSLFIATLSPATLTFTDINWDTAQTVTVTGVDDQHDQITNLVAYIEHSSTSSDTKYSSISIDSVRVTLVDDDGAASGVTFDQTDGSTSVTEAAGAGNTDTYTMVLDNEPTHAVTITVTPGNTAIVTVSPASLIFTTSNYNTAQTVTVTGVDDEVDQKSNRSTTISHIGISDDSSYNISFDSVSVTLVNNDVAAVTKSSDSMSVTEAAGAGNTGTYTVVLDSEPTHTVTIAVASAATAIATVSPAALTFTTSNYNTPQTVTVTGVDDEMDQESNRSTTISHNTTSKDVVYGAIIITDVAITLVDNDGRGVNVTESDGSTSVTEAAGDDNTDTYTVVLSSRPTNDVTIAVASAATAIATVSPAALTFTTSNYNTAQTVTVTGVDDEVDQSSDRSVTISHSAASSDLQYNGISISSITATVVNNDTAEVKINSTEGTGTLELTKGIFVDEMQLQTHNPSSTSTNYLIRLATKPIANVDIEVRSRDPEAARIVILEEEGSMTVRRIMETLTSVTLTFTPTNWNMPQLVSLAGVDDDVDQREHRVAVMTHSAISNDPNYNNIPIRDTLVTVVDDDHRSVRIVESDGATLVSEASGNGNTDTYVVEPTIEAKADVLIRVASSNESIAVSPATLTFTTGNWTTAQTVTVTGVDDTAVQSSDRRATITHTAITVDSSYRSSPIRNVTVTVVDDDKLEVTIAESDGSTRVTEATGDDNTDTYTLMLASLPTASIEVAVASGDEGAATVKPATLTFTTTNGTTAQTVTVTGVDDDVDQRGHHTVTISHSTASSDGSYNTIAITDVTVTIVVDDTAAVTINESGGVSVTEAAGAGRTDRYTVVLASLPTASVEVAVASGDEGAATVKPATLTFNFTNWSTAQTVTVTGVDDNLDQSSDRSVTISHSVTSGDVNYNTMTITPVMAMVVDDDTSAVTINEFGSISVNEAAGDGRTDTYTVALATLPSASVEIAVASGNMAIATVSPTTLTFTTANWNRPQTVTVTGVDNQGTGSNDAVAISHSATSSDGSYNTIAITDVTVTLVDNDGAGVTITESDGATVITEDQLGTPTDTYTVVLNTSPTGDVTINMTSGDAAIVTVNPATLTFTTTNGTTPQTVTVTSLHNLVVQGSDHTVAISHSTASSDVSYNTIAITDVVVTVVDDDTAAVAINESGGVSVTEAAGAGSTDHYTVVLASFPTASVEVAVASGDEGAATVTPATLIFTIENWNSPQTVTVTGVDDNLDQSNDRSVTISHSARSNDDVYDGITIDDVTVTVADAGRTGPLVLPAVQFGAAAYSGGEASGNRMVNVALSATPAFTAPTSLSYRVSGTAIAGEDFAPLSGSVSITGGAGAIPITILDDQIDDDSETIVLTLTAANGYTVGLQANTIITISDDDGATSALPVVSITGIGSGVVEGNPAVFQLSATPAPPAGSTISVNVSISSSGDFVRSGATGSRSVTIDDSGAALVRVSTDDDAIHEADGDITATVQKGRGYSPHSNNSSASLTVADNEVVMLSVTSLKVIEGDSASYKVALDRRPSGQVSVNIMAPQGSELILTPHRVTFTPTKWNEEQSVTVTASDNFHDLNRSLTVNHTATGAIDRSLGLTTQLTVTVVTAQSAEYLKAWNLRLGRTLSQQVVDALQDRLSTPSAEGLQLTVAGEVIPAATPLMEQEGVLSKAMGFEAVTPQEWAEGSSFSLAQHQEGAAPQLAVWGQGAFSSFRGQEDHLSLDGSVTTLLLGADWSTDQWQAGAALSHSWGSGSYDGDDNVAGDISTTLTGLFPYGRYALTPRLAFWAVAGYGWGTLSLQPDGGDDESTPSAAMTMAAGGIDGILLKGGSEGITLSGTADLLTVKSTSASQEELDSSEGSLSRLRLGIEATRLFPLAQGASLLPSMTLGIRQDSGDAESGFGVDWGAGIVWRDPERGISGALQGHILLAHAEENFEEQGLAFSFSWAPNPANRGPSLSLRHTMGAAPSGSMDALLHPVTMEGLETAPSNGQQFEAELAYGFPAHNDHITLTPALALALSPTSNTYTLLWSVAPYSEQTYPAPWALSLAGEREEQNTSTSPVDHSLELRFSTLF